MYTIPPETSPASVPNLSHAGDSSTFHLTQEDRETLGSLLPPMDREWMLSRAQYYAEYARNLRSMYNAGAPIHRHLPPELLMEIFGHLHPKHRREASLLHVCHAWRALLLRTAEFWVDMLSNSVDHAKLFMEPDDAESGELQCFRFSLVCSSPREISLDIHHYTDCSTRLLAPHSHRISLLQVHIAATEAEHLFRLLGSGMPHLTTLVVTHIKGLTTLTRDEWYTLQSYPLKDSLPRLQDLSVATLFLTPSLSFPTLRTLSIGGCTSCNGQCSGQHSMHHLDTILSFLRRCPSLVHLRSLGATTPDPSRRQTHSAPVDLLHLESMELHGPTSWASDLLDKLALPASTTLKLRTRCDGTTVPRSLRTRPALQTPDRIHIQFYFTENVNRRTVCEVQGWRGESLHVDFSTESTVGESGDVIGEVSQTLGSHSVQDLRIWVPSEVIYTTFRVGQQAVQLLASCPQITRLRWRRASPLHVFQALVTRTSGGAPICPHLEHLVVHWRLSPYGGEAMIRRTWETMKTTLERRAELGSPLKKFVLRCENLKHYWSQEDVENVEKDIIDQLQGVVEELKVNAFHGAST
ncbi:hypothetical protein C8Q80DRAFT_1349599 [Daedaleopsis nitida]|nr:hypothetical protein C8Q80DRAFT_1349599 [Daedaleopsis nitida]